MTTERTCVLLTPVSVCVLSSALTFELRPSATHVSAASRTRALQHDAAFPWYSLSPTTHAAQRIHTAHSRNYVTFADARDACSCATLPRPREHNDRALERRCTGGCFVQVERHQTHAQETGTRNRHKNAHSCTRKTVMHAHGHTNTVH